MKRRMITATVAIVLISAFTWGVDCSALEISEHRVNEDNISLYVRDSEQQVGDTFATVDNTDAQVDNIEHVSESERIETVFLIDSSYSISIYSDLIKAYMDKTVDTKPSNEYYSIGQFSGGKSPTYLVEYENDRYDIDKCLADLSFEDNASYIYDNLVNTITALESNGNDCYKRIVLFTDGLENSLSGITYEEVMTRIADNNVQIYTVSLLVGEELAYTNVEELKKIAAFARSSGGEDTQLNVNSTVAECEKAGDVLRTELDKIYKLTITPPADKADSAVHTVEIRMGTETVTKDLRMPRSAGAVQETPAFPADTSETVTTTTMTTPLITTITEAISTSPGPASNVRSSPMRTVVIILIVVAVISFVFAAIMYIISKKQNDEGDEEVSYDRDPLVGDSVHDRTDTLSSDHTEILDSGTNGETEILFGGSAGKKLILRDVYEPSYTFETTLRSDDETIIGRDHAKANIVIDRDRSVSGRHCRIFIRDGRTYIEDLGSSNHTYINDRMVDTAMLLTSGDQIRLGRITLNVTIKEQS